MKKYIVLFALAVSSMMILQGCKKEPVTPEPTRPQGDMEFAIQLPQFADESGAKVHFNDYSFGRLIFDRGDVIYVNGVPFTIDWSSSRNCWVAIGNSADMTNETSDTLLGTSFDVLYYKAPASSPNDYRNRLYQSVKFTDDGVAENTSGSGWANNFTFYKPGIVLAGQTTDSIITMRPTFAIIRVMATMTYDRVAVAFSNDRVLKKGHIEATSGFPTVTSPGRFSPLTQTTNALGKKVTKGHFLVATESNEDMVPNYDAGSFYYYFIVHTDGNATASTSDDYTLYFQIKDGSDTYSTKSTTKYDFQRGTVYTFNLDVTK